VLAPVPPLTPLVVIDAFDPVGQYGVGDRGVDLAGSPGQRVVSATAGSVAFAGSVAGQGVVTVQIGGGRVLTYEPVTPAVRAGAAVAPGMTLGRLAGGHLRCPAAACLHWALRLHGGASADPMALLGPPRVRLLPLSGTGGAGTDAPAAASASAGALGAAPPTVLGAGAAVVAGAGAGAATCRRRRHLRS
jgi:hypothetical protein